MSTSRRPSWWGALAASAALAVSGTALLSPGTAVADAGVAPASLSPSSTSQVHKDLELRWQPVDGATGYQVQVLDDENPDVATILEGTTPVPRWTVPVSLPTGEYVWRVRTTNGTANGPWSALATVERGWDDAPTLRDAVGGPLPQFTWSPVPDASFYQLEISPISFRSPQYSVDKSFVCYTQQTTFTPYAVAVGAGSVFDDAPASEASCTYEITTQDRADAKAAATPTPTAGPSATPTATPSPGSSGTPTPSPTTPTPSASPTAEAAIPTTFIYGKRYFWRVRGRDSTVDDRPTPFPASPGSCTGPWVRSGVTYDPKEGVSVILPTTHDAPVVSPECSRWSAERAFTVVGAPVGLVDQAPGRLTAGPLVSGSTSRVLSTPTFAWNGVPGAVYYRVYLSRDPRIGSVDFAAETFSTSFTPVSSAQLGSTTRYWAVQACGAGQDEPGDDVCGPVSASQPISQVTYNPAAPQSFQATPSHLLATWTTGAVDRSAAKAYDVRVTSLESGTSTTVRTDRVSADLRGGRSSLVVPSSAMAEGRYVFSVRPVDEGDRVTAWSAASPVAVIDHSAPGLSITTPTGFSGRTPVELTASEPVTGVTAASVRLVDGAGRPVAGGLRQVSATRWAFTPAQPWVTGQYVRLRASGVVDRAGKPVTVAGAAVRASRFADSAGSAIAFRGGDFGWSVRTSSDAMGASYRRTADDPRTAVRASALVRVYGTSVSVRVCKSPAGGSAAVYVDGRLRTTASLNRGWTGCANALDVTGLARGEHTVVVVGWGTRGRSELAIDQVAVG